MANDERRTALPSPTELRDALRKHFGHDDFRGPQEDVVRAVLEGRDALVTLPTGGGKSLCYQLPAILLPGLTIVVSPLIALMKDQVDDLRRRGVRAAALHSNLSAEERRAELERARRGELDLLYVTPERFRSRAFRAAEPDLRVARFAVDEAHCISHWGHDFRPDYHRLGEVRERLGDPPTLALTATATPAVMDDIAASLRLGDPFVVRGGIERENLFLSCTVLEREEDKPRLIADRIQAVDGPGIVYSALIRDLEALHGELRRRGVPSLVYHGKLSARERRGMQDRFMSSERDVVLATNAFGMGVDKADIRFVVHAQIPRNLESWAQEIGRAGRDGAPSWCELLYFQEDIAIQQRFVEWANPTLEYLLGVYETLRGWGERIQAKDEDDLRDELLVKNRGDHRVQLCLKWLEVLGVTEGSFERHDLRLVRELDPAELPDYVGSDEKRRGDLEGLLGMVRFASSVDPCRRVQLARHFALDEPADPCGACDVCTDAEAWRARSFDARPMRTADATEQRDGNEGARSHDRARAGSSTDARGARGEDAHGAGSGTDDRRGDEARGDEARGRRATTEWARGDWVRIGRSGYGQVVRVDGEGDRVTLVVEDAVSLKRRTVDPRRGRVEKL